MVSRFTLQRLTVVAIIALLALATACGQKGPLKLPAPEPTQPPHTSSSPAQQQM